MAFTHKITHVWNNGSREISCENEYTNDAQGASIDEEITADAVDQEVAFTLDFSQLKSLFILADGNMTLETNNAAGDDEITLVAGVPYIWNTDSYNSCLITQDVTALFMTDTSSATNRLRIESVYDPTAP